MQLTESWPCSVGMMMAKRNKETPQSGGPQGPTTTPKNAQDRSVSSQYVLYTSQADI